MIIVNISVGKLTRSFTGGVAMVVVMKMGSELQITMTGLGGRDRLRMVGNLALIARRSRWSVLGGWILSEELKCE
jgi:hypothetical protein